MLSPCPQLFYMATTYGFYLLKMFVAWLFSATDVCVLSIRLNGVTVSGGNVRNRILGTDSNAYRL